MATLSAESPHAGADHPWRVALHNEIHARPPEPLQPSLAIAHVVMWCDAGARDRSREHLGQWLAARHQAVPDAQATHLRCEVDGLRLRWELHTEFVAWTFTRPISTLQTERIASGLEAPSALVDIDQTWLAGLPGQRLSMTHLWVLDRRTWGEEPPPSSLLHEPLLVGSTLASGQAEFYTDFALNGDGALRLVLLAGSLSPRQLGRVVQQLLEVETYRMAALMALPVARAATAPLAKIEADLVDLAEAIRSAGRQDEPVLLDRLTRLAAEIEGLYAASYTRFSASAAYFELVDRRIADLGESRLSGLQTVGEFMHRRLTPARATCESVRSRQEALSQRVSRISNLLRTRVEIEQQQSSQALLATMNQRQDTQLKLQSTVEGLSVAAITYYIVGLVSVLAKAANGWGWPLSAEVTSAAAVPVVALAAWWSLRRLHHRLLRPANPVPAQAPLGTPANASKP